MPTVMMRCVPGPSTRLAAPRFFRGRLATPHKFLLIFFDTKGASYARPTALFTADPSGLDHGGRMPPMADPSFMLASNPSAFSALSSVAVEELYALERAEALRRAEYEIRHTEALRRAEYEARHADILSLHGRLSKSASTTPMMTPFFPPQHAEEGGSYFGVSRERELNPQGAAVPRKLDGDESVHHIRNSSRRLRVSSTRREQSRHVTTVERIVNGTALLLVESLELDVIKSGAASNVWMYSIKFFVKCDAT